MSLLNNLSTETDSDKVTAVNIELPTALNRGLIRASAQYGVSRRKVAQALLAQAMVDAGFVSESDASAALTAAQADEKPSDAATRKSSSK